MTRTDAPNRWKTLTVVIFVGGAVGWALVRSSRVVLAPTRAGAGAGTDAGTGVRPQTTSAGGAGAFGEGGSARESDPSAPPPRVFRTADALAGAASQGGSTGAGAEVEKPTTASPEGAGGPATAGGDVAELDRPLVPSAWTSAHGMVEETPEAQSLDPDSVIALRSGGNAGTAGTAGRSEARRGAAETGIAHPGTVAAGLGAPPPGGERGADPWGEDAPLGAAGCGPGQPAGEAFGSVAAEALFAADAASVGHQMPSSDRLSSGSGSAVNAAAAPAPSVAGLDRAAATTENVDAADVALGLASAQAIGHGVAPAAVGADEPEPSLGELQGEARDMVLGTGGTAPAGAAATWPEEGTGAGGGKTGRAAAQPGGGAAKSASQPVGGAAKSATPGGFVPQGAVAGDGSHACPDGYPIKGNASSRIFHVPGGSSYEQTIAEFCFATAEDAENAGYRATKR